MKGPSFSSNIIEHWIFASGSFVFIQRGTHRFSLRMIINKDEKSCLRRKTRLVFLLEYPPYHPVRNHMYSERSENEQLLQRIAQL